MVRVGDEVVVMSAAGRFRVVAVKDDVLTIENAQGVRKTVLEASIRSVAKREPSAA
jgi:preprotein translocase subunit YajC